MKLIHLLGIAALACAPMQAQFGDAGGVGGFGGGPVGQSQMDQSGNNLTPGIGFLPWLSVNGNYSRTLNADQLGVRGDRFMGSAAGGIGGTKSWENSSLTAGYLGSGTYNNLSFARSAERWRQSHVVNLGYGRQVNQHWQFRVSSFGGLSDGGFGVGSAYGSTGIPGLGGGFGLDTGGGGLDDPNQNGLVDNELLSSRVKFYAGRGAVSYRVSERFSVGVFGGASFARRTNGLNGLNSYNGGSGATYQLNRTTQVGANYSRTNLDYVGFFGGVHFDTAAIGMQKELSQRMRIVVQGGASRLSSTFIGSTPIAPDLAALLGISNILEVKQTKRITGSGRAVLTYNTPSSHFNVGFDHGLAPGNGLLYASIRDVVNVGYGFPIGQKIGINFIANYYRMAGQVAVLRNSQSAQGGAMASYRLFRSVSATMQGGYRYIAISGSRQQRDTYVGIGLAWRPADGPFIF